MNFVCFNGEIKPTGQPLFGANNRSFKYGDGVFETIKVCQKRIPLANLHFERLFLSLKLLKIKFSFEEAFLTDAIIDLCQKNSCSDLARVRLAVYREEDNSAGFLIEAIPLPAEANMLNEKGLVVDFYPYTRKSKDAFSNLKTANFLPYVLAGLYAKEKNLDDSIVLNCDNHICDTSKANIFLIKNEEIYTPALHQGCVNGVMRRFLMDGLKNLNFSVHQQEITEEDLTNANEVFLSNAIYGMRWVKSFKNNEYANAISFFIYQQLVATIFK
jgi:branched-chain amino acid aminotransferase